jgi:hypothetical protein
MGDHWGIDVTPLQGMDSLLDPFANHEESGYLMVRSDDDLEL